MIQSINNTLFLLFLCIAYCDVRWRVVPNVFLLPLMTCAIYRHLFFATGRYDFLLNHCLGACLLLLSCFLIAYLEHCIRRPMIGAGDLKLTAALMLIFSTQQTIKIVFLASLLTIASVPFSTLAQCRITDQCKSDGKKLSLFSLELPFATFLSVSTIVLAL